MTTIRMKWNAWIRKQSVTVNPTYVLLLVIAVVVAILAVRGIRPPAVVVGRDAREGGANPPYDRIVNEGEELLPLVGKQATIISWVHERRPKGWYDYARIKVGNVIYHVDNVEAVLGDDGSQLLPGETGCLRVELKLPDKTAAWSKLTLSKNCQ